jgi:starch phosphorylase
MRESMARLTPQFSANRAVREYTEQRYLPAASNYRLRTSQKGQLGRQMVESRHRLEKQWDGLHFGEIKVETWGGQHLFEVQVFLSDLDPQAVRVELCANGVQGGAFARQEMKLSDNQLDVPGSHVYSTSVSSDRPSGDYSARLVPHLTGVSVPLEDARILWQR